MKRDMELIRRILLTVENEEMPGHVYRGFRGSWYEDIEDNAFFYHVKMLQQVGYIECIVLPVGDDNPPHYYPTELTMTGHDFLNSIRSQSVWQRMKDKLGADFGTVPLEVIKTVGVDLALSWAKAKFGLAKE